MKQEIISIERIKNVLGDSYPAFEKLISEIRYYYVMDEDFKEGNPNHKHYNNLYIRRSGKALVSISLREGYFILGVVLGKIEREKFDKVSDEFDNVISSEYDLAEIYHDGKWMAFNIKDDTLINDIIKLIKLKKKPNRKVYPILEDCKKIDFGYKHQDITNKLFNIEE